MCPEVIIVLQCGQVMELGVSMDFRLQITFKNNLGVNLPLAISLYVRCCQEFVYNACKGQNALVYPRQSDHFPADTIEVRMFLMVYM